MGVNSRGAVRLIVAAAVLAAAGAKAATIPGVAGDFLPSYVGPQNGDVDLLSISAFYNANEVRLSSVLNAPIGTTPGALYVWGINRGGNTAPFGAFQPGVLFDSVVVLSADGTGNVVLFTPGGPVATPLAVGAVTISGATVAVRVPTSLLPSNGFALLDYGYNLWPRVGLGNNNQISEFLPRNGTFTASFVPEPGVWAMMIAGFGLVGLSLRRRATPPRYATA